MAQSNDSEQAVDTTFDEMFRPLQEPLEQHEQNRLPHHRETLSFMVFVRKNAREIKQNHYGLPEYDTLC